MRMIDVAAKPVTERRARASARVRCLATTVERLRSGSLDKGDALAVARLAGVMAAKRTADVVPLCHPLPLDAVEVTVLLPPPGDAMVTIEAVVRATARTGVEMEALVAATAAALALYDCCKSIDRGMVIEQVQLDEKEGGRSGAWRR
ncbi:MAG: cyclic pyranopterin monophosphate synthase MoaC [Planctomycetes bacterium]|nr:cyclic pyranopterin monophosphate synthase MoaC [Planctomycetota bacterium]